MYTEFNDQHIYNYSENVSDFLSDYLTNNNHIEEWSYTTQKIDNPKVTFLEQRIAALEGGIAAFAVKSFNKAKLSVIKSILHPGDNIVTYNSFSLYHRDKARLNRAGIQVKISEDGKLDTFEKLIDQKTKLIYLETISPEYLNIPDFQKIITIAKALDIPVLVDNTAGAAGYITRPLKNGANIIIESTKNWLPSHKELIGAVIVDGGNYNWENGKFPQFNQPKLNYLELNSIDHPTSKEKPASFSLINFIKKEGNINHTLYNIPEDPFSLIHDLENLSTVVQNQSDNAHALALWLKENDAVKEVLYTGFPDNSSYFKALTFFRNGFGSNISFSIKDQFRYKELQSYLKSENNPLKDHFSFEEGKVHFNLPYLELKKIKRIFLKAFEQINKKEEYPSLKEYQELNSLSAII